eukprot:TRINITY_DN34899_c0_g1_i1.p1 TRINITY_DN34899_c0_g1~~TRINITY_DN34899_c0_g1_i1.p1  ORF type:complete len:1035 (+),score=542.72 TRINITY_DN34899_c0_g1_i1:112-3216(+)
MDTQQLYNVLQVTFTDPNLANRKAAEDQIMQASAMPGALKAFYEIATADHVAAPVRQAASIRFKHLVRKDDWNAENSPVAAEEKAHVKGTFLHALATSPLAVQKQLCDSLMHIVAYDFPDRWAELPGQINEFLNSSEPPKNLAALRALRTLSKRYESVASGSARRQDVEKLGHAFFPALLAIFKRINGMAPVQNAEVASLQKWILKIFFSSNYASVMDYLKTNDQICKEWMECLLFTLKMPLDASGDVQTAWKAKKWVGYIIAMILEKERTRKTRDAKFSEKVRGVYCKGFVTTAVQLLIEHNPMVYANRPAEVWPDRKAVCRLIDYVTAARGMKQLHAEAAPHLDELLQTGLFPLMIFTTEEMELWESNPQEYVRKTNCINISEDFANPSLYAVTYLKDICENSGGKYHDGGVTVRYLEFVNRVLHETSNFSDIGQMRRRYAALRAVGMIRNVLLNTPQVKATLEQFLTTHALPMLTSQFGFMRAQAIWVASRFAGKITWSSPEKFAQVLSANVTLMGDADLPVRVSAGTVLQKIVGNKQAVSLVKPMLGQVVQKCFTLMDEIDSEQLIQTLEVIILNYGEELTGQCIEICNSLIQHFMRLSQGIFSDEGPDMDALEENLESIAAAEKCLTAMGSFVYALKDQGETIVHLQPVFLPLLDFLLTERCFDLFDTTIRLITTVTAYSKVIAPEFWVVFDRLEVAFSTFADQEIRESVGPFDNFISKDCKAFLSDSTRLTKFGQFCQFVLEHEHFSWTDKTVVPELIEVLLQHSKAYGNLLDPVLENFYDVVLKALGSNSVEGYCKVLLCNVLANGFYYNAQLTLQYLEKRNATAVFFSSFLDLLPKYQRSRDLKVAVLGVLSVLEVAVAQALPASITPEMQGRMSQAVLRLTVDRLDMLMEEDEEDEEISDDSDEGTYDGADDDEGEDEDGAHMLPAEIREQLEQERTKIEEGDGFEFDEFIANDSTEGVWSVIDEINEAAMAESYLHMLKDKNPGMFQEVVKSLDGYINRVHQASEYGAKKAEEAKKANANRINV